MKILSLITYILIVCVMRQSEAKVRKSHSGSRNKRNFRASVAKKHDSFVKKSKNLNLYDYQAGSQNGKSEEKKELRLEDTPAKNMRFSRVASNVAPLAQVHPFGGLYEPSPLQYGNHPTLSGMYNGAAPMYGMYGSNYGPFQLLTPNSGYGSATMNNDPRGFNAQWNFSNVRSNPFGMEPILRDRGPNSFPAKIRAVTGGGIGMPPFTGRPFSAQGPHGPYALHVGGRMEPGNTNVRNVTVMGPLPFGPYGKSPEEQPFAGAVGAGVRTFGPPMGQFQGVTGAIPLMYPGGLTKGLMNPMQHGMNPMQHGMGYMGAGAMVGNTMGMPGAMPGLRLTYSPQTMMQRSLFMGGNVGIPTPGVLHTGQGYPSPDHDHYASVIPSPPHPRIMGGAEAGAPPA